jgi:hypothetical protein
MRNRSRPHADPASSDASNDCQPFRYAQIRARLDTALARIQTVIGTTLGDLKNDLLDTTHRFRVIGLEKVQDFDHVPLITL